MKLETVKDVPLWAASYLEYGEEYAVDFTDEDWVAVRKFEDWLKSEGLRLVSIIKGSANEFCAHPAFGPACATADWTAEHIGKEVK